VIPEYHTNLQKLRSSTTRKSPEATTLHKTSHVQRPRTLYESPRIKASRSEEPRSNFTWDETTCNKLTRTTCEDSQDNIRIHKIRSTKEFYTGRVTCDFRIPYETPKNFEAPRHEKAQRQLPEATTLHKTSHVQRPTDTIRNSKDRGTTKQLNSERKNSSNNHRHSSPLLTLQHHCEQADHYIDNRSKKCSPLRQGNHKETSGGGNAGHTYMSVTKR